jgi:hypothetical protein
VPTNCRRPAQVVEKDYVLGWLIAGKWSVFIDIHLQSTYALSRGNGKGGSYQTKPGS